MAIYLDASAFAKLILDEPGSESLRELVGDRAPRSGDHLRTELRRAIRRRTARLDPATQDAAFAEVDARLAYTDLIALAPDLLDSAGRLPDPVLRSLDAIHVAAALAVADEVEAFVTYDERQARAARAAGFIVVQPGR